MLRRVIPNPAPTRTAHPIFRIKLTRSGECRRLIEASTGVRPFGTAYHAIHLVTTAIDTLAFFITGVQHFYAIGGSVQAAAPVPLVAVVPRYDDADEPE